MKNFFSVMLKCKDVIYERKDRLAAEAFLKIKNFVEEGSYSHCKKADVIAKYTLLGYDTKFLAEKFNITYQGAKSEKRKVSEELWSIFPFDFFDKLKDYRENRKYVDDFLYSLSMFNLKSDDLLLWDLANINIPDNDNSVVYDDLSLTDEIDFLCRYSKLFFESDLKGINESKLKYLMCVLDGTIKDPSLRVLVLKKLRGANYD